MALERTFIESKFDVVNNQRLKFTILTPIYLGFFLILLVCWRTIMSISDHDYVNFSEDHELNYHLRKVNKAQSEKNRSTLRKIGELCKKELGVSRVTHKQFHSYVLKYLNHLDN